jgi:REP element-mobilizing transposase RayT
MGKLMAGTYSQIYIHVIFAVKGRRSLLQKPWRDEVFKYMAGIIKNKDQKAIIVNGVDDHTHLLVGLTPAMCLSDLIRDVKNNSTNFINKQKWILERFNWQEGYSAFSYSHSQISSVYNYILNQETHHSKKSFREEYYKFLKMYEIKFDQKYVFDWIE